MKTQKHLPGGGAGTSRRAGLQPAGAATDALDHLGALVGLDARWTIRSATQGLGRFLGRPVETAIGDPLRALLSPSTAEATITALAATVQAGGRAAIPATLADDRPVLLLPVPNRLPSAQIQVVVTDMLEIGAPLPRPEPQTTPEPRAAEGFRTRLLEVEQQLMEAEIRSARRQAELTRDAERLREAQGEQARREKVSALERLAAGAAHEINNPLAAVVGNAELLVRREALSPEAQQRLERIVSAAYRIARIVDQLLVFVRAQPPDLAPLDPVRLLREVVAERARTLELEGLSVVDELDALPPVPADARQLGQVFGHVLDNALDAIRERPEGWPRTLRLASRRQPGGIELRIANSGPPIADGALPRIFDPFFTTKDVGRGAGLGLSVCQGIVAAHGGRVRAENTADGAALVIELPLAGPGAVSPE